MDDPLTVLLPCPYLFGHELYRTDGDFLYYYYYQLFLNFYRNFVRDKLIGWL